jgi:ribonuclease HI
MQTYKLNPDTTAKIEVAVRNPLKANSTPFRISIADSKELSKAESSAATETIKIYTDGSVINNKVGAAAVLMKPGKPPQVLHYYLGSETKHTIHEAELVGLCMGAHFIKTEKKGRTSFALGADSQAAIKTLTTNLIQPAQHIALNLLKTTAQIQEKRGSNKYSLTLRWTAGHVGIEGNERADKEAKIAAGGTTSDRKLLPPFLRRNLVTNPIALKQHHNKTIKHKWKTKWRSSQRGAKMVVLDETTPSSTFLNTISGHKLTRKASSTLAQLRIGHIPLNSYLYKFKLVDNRRCPACGAAAESIHHFLITCPTYRYERWPLQQKCKRTLTLKMLLTDNNLTEHLINYIEATKRFEPRQETELNQQGELINPGR